VSRCGGMKVWAGPEYIIIIIVVVFVVVVRRYAPWARRTFYHYMYVQQVHRKTTPLRQSKLKLPLPPYGRVKTYAYPYQDFSDTNPPTTDNGL
jgi:hypothetical protein